MPSESRDIPDNSITVGVPVRFIKSIVAYLKRFGKSCCVLVASKGKIRTRH